MPTDPSNAYTLLYNNWKKKWKQQFRGNHLITIRKENQAFNFIFFFKVRSIKVAKYRFKY